jgi:hypothetical protein
MKTLTRIGALSLLATLAACNTDTTAAPETPAAALVLDRDVALQAGDAAAQDLELMGASGGLLGLGLAPSATAEEDVPFRCGVHTRDGLTITRTCTFKDAGGVTQSGYDALTTASAAIHVTIKGTVTRENWTADVDRVRDLAVTGLAGSETQRTWNGTGSGIVSREKHTENGGSRSYDVTYTLTVTSVVVPVPRTPTSWPLSGTATRAMHITVVGGPNSGKTRDRTVTITFNGTQFVPITINGKTFTFDLKTRKIVDN